jgi:type VI secretion system protein ImpI
MDMMLEIVSRQKYSADFPTSHVFGEVGGYIGRSRECEWILPDKGKNISRQHALVTFENGDFYIEDISANGVYYALGKEALPKRTRCKIEHGEGFIIGEYTIMARLLHNPSAYVRPAASPNNDILRFDSPLPLDPLAAMDEEEQRIAVSRMGQLNDILGATNPAPLIQPDHNDPRISTLLHVRAVSEDSLVSHGSVIAEDWGEGDASEPMPYASFRDVAYAKEEQAEEVRHVYQTVPETDVFFTSLGFAAPPQEPEERERILRLAAQLLNVAVGELAQALQNRAACKNELRLPVTTTNLAISNNPLKISPTPQAAMSHLLEPEQKGILPPVQSIHAAFADLHRHHMGLLAGARAAVRASLEKLSPQAVEARLDINGPVRLNRTAKLWHTFIRMYQSLHDDHAGFAALFLQDFTRAYEVQGRTLNPRVERQKGAMP